jgi:hypothetical protein
MMTGGDDAMVEKPGGTLARSSLGDDNCFRQQFAVAAKNLSSESSATQRI